MSDLISRQALCEYVFNQKDKCVTPNDIMRFPSAQPQRKTGKWIKLDMHAHIADHKCTACGQECYVPTCMGEPMYTYCPNCGADMRTEENDDN